MLKVDLWAKPPCCMFFNLCLRIILIFFFQQGAPNRRPAATSAWPTFTFNAPGGWRRPARTWWTPSRRWKSLRPRTGRKLWPWPSTRSTGRTWWEIFSDWTWHHQCRLVPLAFQTKLGVMLYLCKMSRVLYSLYERQHTTGRLPVSDVTLLKTRSMNASNKLHRCQLLSLYLVQRIRSSTHCHLQKLWYL